YKRARELQPTLVHQWYASYLLTLNRVPEAEIEYRKFADFLPFRASNFGLAQYFYFIRQDDRAVDIVRKKLEMNPDHPLLRQMLGLIYEQQGRTDEAMAELQKTSSFRTVIMGWDRLGTYTRSWGEKAMHSRRSSRSPSNQSAPMFRLTRRR